eukprot:2399257-Amphidinium_carterae.1
MAGGGRKGERKNPQYTQPAYAPWGQYTEHRRERTRRSRRKPSSSSSSSSQKRKLKQVDKAQRLLQKSDPGYSEFLRAKAVEGENAEIKKQSVALAAALKSTFEETL